MAARFLAWLRGLRRRPTPEELEAQLEAQRLLDKQLTARSRARHHRR